MSHISTEQIDHIEVEEVDSQEESLGLDRKMLVTEATDRTKTTPYRICNKTTVLYVERFRGGNTMVTEYFIDEGQTEGRWRFF